MSVYFLELALLVILGYLLNSGLINNKFFLGFSFFMMASVLGFRGDLVGEDTTHYLFVFDSIRKLSWKTIVSSGIDVPYAVIYSSTQKIEVGYAILNKTVGLFTNNGHCLLLIVAYITCFLFARFIYNNFTSVYMPTYIFMCGSLYMEMFNLSRQLLAMSIGIQAFKLLKNNRLVQSLLVLFVAVIFHKTAICLLICIPLYFLSNYRKGLIITLLFFVSFYLGNPIFYRIISTLIPQYSKYFVTNYWGFSIHGIVVLWILEIILCALLYHNGIKNDTSYVTIMFVIIYIALQLVGMNISVFQRISLYFLVGTLNLFPIAEDCFSVNSKITYRYSVYIIMAFLFFSYANAESRQYYTWF